MEDLHKPLYLKLRFMVSSFSSYIIDLAYANFGLYLDRSCLWNRVVNSCINFEVLIDDSLSKVFRKYEGLKEYYSEDIIIEYRTLDWKDARASVENMHVCLIDIRKSWDSLVLSSEKLKKKEPYVMRTLGGIGDALDSWQEFVEKKSATV